VVDLRGSTKEVPKKCPSGPLKKLGNWAFLRKHEGEKEKKRTKKGRENN